MVVSGWQNMLGVEQTRYTADKLDRLDKMMSICEKGLMHMCAV